jgi:hypothetical protein
MQVVTLMQEVNGEFVFFGGYEGTIKGRSQAMCVTRGNPEMRSLIANMVDGRWEITHAADLGLRLALFGGQGRRYGNWKHMDLLMMLCRSDCSCRLQDQGAETNQGQQLQQQDCVAGGDPGAAGAGHRV